uniref:Uncharacterized protein n=1 Tax=Meloidogyne hapla TaxID=6305 RepID=A0A1I8BQU4_MELHA
MTCKLGKDHVTEAFEGMLEGKHDIECTCHECTGNLCNSSIGIKISKMMFNAFCGGYSKLCSTCKLTDELVKKFKPHLECTCSECEGEFCNNVKESNTGGESNSSVGSNISGMIVILFFGNSFKEICLKIFKKIN